MKLLYFGFWPYLWGLVMNGRVKLNSCSSGVSLKNCSAWDVSWSPVICPRQTEKTFSLDMVKVASVSFPLGDYMSKASQCGLFKQCWENEGHLSFCIEVQESMECSYLTHSLAGALPYFPPRGRGLRQKIKEEQEIHLPIIWVRISKTIL